jgi:plasmid stabilization system protein ParE
MSRYRLTSKAEADLFAIWSYIAADNINAADRVETAIYETCALLAESPPYTEGFNEFAGSLLDSATISELRHRLRSRSQAFEYHSHPSWSKRYFPATVSALEFPSSFPELKMAKLP